MEKTFSAVNENGKKVQMYIFIYENKNESWAVSLFLALQR